MKKVTAADIVPGAWFVCTSKYIKKTKGSARYFFIHKRKNNKVLRTLMFLFETSGGFFFETSWRPITSIAPMINIWEDVKVFKKGEDNEPASEML